MADRGEPAGPPPVVTQAQADIPVLPEFAEQKIRLDDPPWDSVDKNDWYMDLPSFSVQTEAVAAEMEATLTSLATFVTYIDGWALGGVGGAASSLLNATQISGTGALSNVRGASYIDPTRGAPNATVDYIDYVTIAKQLVPGYAMAAAAQVAYNRVFSRDIVVRRKQALSSWPLAAFHIATVVTAIEASGTTPRDLGRTTDPLLWRDGSDARINLLAGLRGDSAPIRGRLQELNGVQYDTDHSLVVTDVDQRARFAQDWDSAIQQRALMFSGDEPVGPLANEFVDTAVSAIGIGYTVDDIMDAFKRQMKDHDLNEYANIFIRQGQTYAELQQVDLLKDLTSTATVAVVPLWSREGKLPGKLVVMPAPIAFWGRPLTPGNFGNPATYGVPHASAFINLTRLWEFADGFDAVPTDILNSYSWDDFDWETVLRRWLTKLRRDWLSFLTKTVIPGGIITGIQTPVSVLGPSRVKPTYRRTVRLYSAMDSFQRAVDRANTTELHISSGVLADRRRVFDTATPGRPQITQFWQPIPVQPISAVLSNEESFVGVLNRKVGSVTQIYVTVPATNPNYAAVLRSDIVRWRLVDANLLARVRNPTVRAAINEAVTYIRDICKDARITLWTLIEYGPLQTQLSNFASLWVMYVDAMTKGKGVNDPNSSDAASQDILKYAEIFKQMEPLVQTVEDLTVVYLADPSVAGSYMLPSTQTIGSGMMLYPRKRSVTQRTLF